MSKGKFSIALGMTLIVIGISVMVFVRGEVSINCAGMFCVGFGTATVRDGCRELD